MSGVLICVFLVGVGIALYLLTRSTGSPPPVPRESSAEPKRDTAAAWDRRAQVAARARFDHAIEAVVPDRRAGVDLLPAHLRTYRSQVESVLTAAGRIDPGALDRTRRNAASAALTRTETLLAGPADRSQMLALADLPVPVHPGWRPARELAEHCGAAGRVLRDEADEHHTRFGHWVREVSTRAQAIRADVEARVETDITVLADGRSVARELLDKAAHEVRLRASVLGGAQPEAT